MPRLVGADVRRTAPLALRRAHPLAQGLVGAWAPHLQGAGALRDWAGRVDLPLASGTTYGPTTDGAGLSATVAGQGALLSAIPTHLRLTDSVTVAWLGVAIGTPDLNAILAGTTYDNANTSPWCPYQLFVSSTAIHFATDNGGTFNHLQSSSPLATGAVTSVVGTNVSGDQRLYVNGIQVTNSTAAGTLTYAASAEFSTGPSGGFSRNPNTVTLAVLVYDRVLSPAEIWQLYDPRSRWALWAAPEPRLWSGVAPTTPTGSGTLAAGAAHLSGSGTVSPQAGTGALKGMARLSGTGTVTGAGPLTLRLGPSVTTQTGTVTVSGTTPVYPTWAVTGPLEYLQLTNVSTSATWSVTASLLAGETLLVNMDPTKQLVMDSLGQTFATSGTMWGFPQGTSTFRVTAGGITSASSVALSYAPG